MLARSVVGWAGLLAGCKAADADLTRPAQHDTAAGSDTFQSDTGQAETGALAETANPDSADSADSATDSGDTATEEKGDWLMVSASTDDFACGLRLDGTASCWGQNDHGQTTPPEGQTFITIETLSATACGLRADGEVACWGNEAREKELFDPPPGPWVALHCGSDDCVAIDPGGHLAWWGSGAFAQQSAPTGEFVSADVARSPGEVCAVDSAGALRCWDPDGVEYAPLSGTFAWVTLGGGIGCAVDSTGSPSCWCYNEGAESMGIHEPPAAAYASIDLANLHACGLTTAGEALCWGESRYWWGSESTVPPAGTYQSVDAGDGFSCGVTVDQHAVCWGLDDYGQSTPPS